MTYTKYYPILLAIFVSTTIFFIACEKDKNPSSSSGEVNIEITDSPCDDPNVKAVFVTVAEVKIDGQTFSGFSGKKSIDLLAYQKGDVAVLGLGNIEAGSYQNVSLVLDAQTDANGNSPGCYVQTADNVKHSLSATASHSITASHDFVVQSGSKTNLVIDFDLRKAVQYQTGGGMDHYDFVGTADLASAVRIVVKNETGTMAGTCQNSIVITDKMIAHVYKKGEFDRNVEVSSENGVAFNNAVASSSVGANGEFAVAFLESGDYEIHFAAYKDNNNDGKLEFQGTLVLDSLVDLDNIRVSSNVNLDLNLMVVGILP